jgi:hypothetical protein
LQPNHPESDRLLEHNTRVTHDPASNESVTLATIELPVVCFMDHVLAIAAGVKPFAKPVVSERVL